MAIEARNRPLPEWLTRIRTGQTVLPRFQRFEAWDRNRVAQLFNTILRDLPVGAALVLEVGDKEKFVSRPLKGAGKGSEKVSEHLLDGQQRLTALWRGLNNNYEDATYFLWLEADEETGAPYSVWVQPRWKREGSPTLYPAWANDPAKQWGQDCVPLDLCRPDNDSKAVRDWAKAAIPDEDDRENFIDLMNEIRLKFSGFNLPFLSLPVTTPTDVALDVFMKMNTTAAPLSMFDIVVAQVEAGAGQSLHDLVADLRRQTPALGDYYDPESLIIYVAALLQDKSPTNATYLARGFAAHLVEAWPKILVGAARAVEFLESERIYDRQRLPTDVVVPVLTALWAEAPSSMDAEGRARTLIRRYMWRAFFTNRYESSTNSRALEDYRSLKALFISNKAPQPDLFDETLFPLPSRDEIATARWPKNKDRLARAILAVALKQGGHDFADGREVSRAELARREYHHIFPDAYLKKQGLAERDIFRSLNCAVVTWITNRKMSDKPPVKYLAERKDGADLGESEVSARLESHLIPYGAMKANDYWAYLEARAELIEQAMKKVCASPA